VVIGGASGIGLATARRFAAEGANVVIADLDDEQAAVLDLAGPDAVLLGTPRADSSHWLVAVLREVSG
jgi:NAD(P)-dependent dehydrogenase (short-subunit alcohol dehydrogenase family)